jgi:hypothetical protein
MPEPSVVVMPSSDARARLRASGLRVHERPGPLAPHCLSSRAASPPARPTHFFRTNPQGWGSQSVAALHLPAYRTSTPQFEIRPSLFPAFARVTDSVTGVREIFSPNHWSGDLATRRMTRKRLPWPAVLSTSMRPPWSWRRCVRFLRMDQSGPRWRKRVEEQERQLVLIPQRLGPPTERHWREQGRSESSSQYSASARRPSAEIPYPKALIKRSPWRSVWVRVSASRKLEMASVTCRLKRSVPRSGGGGKPTGALRWHKSLN